MSITLLPNGMYKVNVYMGAEFSRYVATAETRQEALILEQEAKLRKLKGETQKKKTELTFKDVYELWWKKKYTVTKHHEENTLDNTEAVFRLHILPYLGHLNMKKINLDVLEDLQILWAFGDKRRKIKPYVNFKRCVSYTKQVMKYARLKDYIADNPYELLEMPVNENLRQASEEKRQSKYYDLEEIRANLEAIKELYGMQAYVLLALLYSIGAAKGEVFPLVWEDVNFKQMTISFSHKLVKSKKTQKFERVKGMKNQYRYRVIPISYAVCEMLKEWKQEQKEELKKIGIKQTEQQFIFSAPSINGEPNLPIHSDWLYTRLKRISQEKNLVRLTPHGLRHTYVSDLLNQGIDELIVKSLVGHAETSRMTREVYGHANKQKAVETVNELETIRNS